MGMTCAIMAGVDARESPAWDGREDWDPSVPGRLIGLRAGLARPFWGIAGSWSVLCGALASDQLRWTGQELLSLSLVLLVVELGWGSLWDLLAGANWLRLLRHGWPAVGSTPLGGLPYTQPASSAGRLLRGIKRLAGWWQAFWPVGGPLFIGWVAAAAFTCVLALILPERLYLLHVIAVSLALLGVVIRRGGKPWLAGQALAQVGLGWMAGHLTFSAWTVPSLVLAVAFALAVWGVLRAMRGLAGASWLVNGGQSAGLAVLIGLKQPLAAGLIGLLLLGQIALQPSLRHTQNPERVASRSWLWMLLAMVVAALALP